MVRCADPVLCYVSVSGKRIFRNWSLARDSFRESAQLVFDCNKCIFCRKKRAYELACRCVLHSSLYDENCFLTLTYDEKKEGYHNVFSYEDIQKFKKRLRISAFRSKQRRLEIFNVHEYGRNGKKHWHLVVFNYDFSDKVLHTYSGGLPLYTSKELSELWPFGFNTIGDVSQASAMYQAQYMEKDFKHQYVASSKRSHSRHSGIGREYFRRYFDQILRLGFVPVNGRRLPVPRYFQKLAHRHYCHFYDRSKFYEERIGSVVLRKPVYRFFTKDRPSLEIANLWPVFLEMKEVVKRELEKNWSDFMENYLTTKEEPDFIKAGRNALYDLRNKLIEERF